jgi:hypothetical protein
MDEVTQTVGFRATPQEIAKMDEEAKAAGLSRADYVRSKVLAPPAGTLNANSNRMLEHLGYMINQVHEAIYSIAEAEGEAGRFLSTAQLREVYDAVRVRSIQYALDFSDQFAAIQAAIAAAKKGTA